MRSDLMLVYRQPPLDYAAALCCGWMAMVIFSVHVISSPKRVTWMNIPEYVRFGLAVTGAMFTWRSVNFVSNRSLDLGHINTEGLLATFALTYTLTALAWWIWSRQLSNYGWPRLQWSEHEMREDPEKAPVIMTMDEVVNTARAVGYAAVKPDAPPSDLAKASGDVRRYRL